MIVDDRKAARDAAGQLFGDLFTAAGWTASELESYDGWCIREAVLAIAAGGEEAALRRIISEHGGWPGTMEPLAGRCMTVIAQARSETGQPPYPQEALDAAAAELARQRHGGPADPGDIRLASDVLNAAFAARTAG
jgi:hypothetical protein